MIPAPIYEPSIEQVTNNNPQLPITPTTPLAQTLDNRFEMYDKNGALFERAQEEFRQDLIKIAPWEGERATAYRDTNGRIVIHRDEGISAHWGTTWNDTLSNEAREGTRRVITFTLGTPTGEELPLTQDMITGEDPYTYRSETIFTQGVTRYFELNSDLLGNTGHGSTIVVEISREPFTPNKPKPDVRPAVLREVSNPEAYPYVINANGIPHRIMDEAELYRVGVSFIRTKINPPTVLIGNALHIRGIVKFGNYFEHPNDLKLIGPIPYKPYIYDGLPSENSRYKIHGWRTNYYHTRRGIQSFDLPINLNEVSEVEGGWGNTLRPRSGREWKFIPNPPRQPLTFLPGKTTSGYATMRIADSYATAIQPFVPKERVEELRSTDWLAERLQKAGIKPERCFATREEMQAALDAAGIWYSVIG